MTLLTNIQKCANQTENFGWQHYHRNGSSSKFKNALEVSFEFQDSGSRVIRLAPPYSIADENIEPPIFKTEIQRNTGVLDVSICHCRLPIGENVCKHSTSTRDVLYCPLQPHFRLHKRREKGLTLDLIKKIL
jgi:hypothetical protein